MIGGETAEMPGLYQKDDYDLAGFCVGIVEKAAVIDGQKINIGDAVIGIAASGFHSNGYSLIRKIVASQSLDQMIAERSLIDWLLEPTRIYVKSLHHLFKNCPVHAVAHITGGGLLENVPRVLPPGHCAYLDPTTWVRPPIFDWLQQQVTLSNFELYRTFNCGIGMIACVPAQEASNALRLLQEHGETAWQIGVIEACTHNQVQLAGVSL